MTQQKQIFGKFGCADCKEKCHFYNVNKPNEQAKIQHVTMNVGCILRSRPAAPETEHEQYERICKEVSQEEHDATIAKAERERVLKECCKQCPIRNEEMPLDDRCAESCEGCLIKSVVEHLRTASTGDDER